MTPVAARKYLEDALPFGVWAEASRVLGRNHAYIQQYITRGTPRWLGEQDRHILARAYGLDEDRLRPPPRLPRVGAKKAGVHRRDDADVGPQRFDEIIDDPRALELIHACLRIVGDDEKKTALDVLTALGEASLRALRGLVAASSRPTMPTMPTLLSASPNRRRRKPNPRRRLLSGTILLPKARLPSER